jgi:hypothetical protein
MRTRPLIALVWVLSLCSCLHAKNNKKLILPTYVLEAKTLAVVVDPNAPVSALDPDDNKQAADAVEQALMKWGRYKLVSDPSWADLVIMIRKGRPPGPAVGGVGNGSDRPVIVQEPTDSQTRVGVQWGVPPQVSATQQQQQQRQPQPGVETGTTDDIFEVFQGQSQYPLDGPRAWSYSGKNVLDAPKVKAVEEFHQAVIEAEKARK